MKNTILISVIALFFGSCMETRYIADYNAKLDNVDKNDSIFDVDGYIYDDSLFSISWQPTNKGFGFTLENKSNTNIQIIWEGAAMVIDGYSQRVFHSNVKYIDAEKYQPPTTIVKGTTLDDIVVPVDGIKFNSYGNNPKWEVKNIFPETNTNKIDQTKNEANTNLGIKYVVSLPLKINDKTTDYLFHFKLYDYTISTKKAASQTTKATGNLLLCVGLISILVSFFTGP